MKFKFYSLLLTVFLSISFVSTAFASHAMGADLTYSCVGGNTYQFRLSFYRDCAGITPSTAITLNISSASCGISGLTLTINQQSVQEVSPICPAQLAQSTCNGGTLPGVQQYVYTGTYTMPANCTDWVISFSECCRNSAITNLTTPDAFNLYVEANMNNLNATCNNSPDFTTLPVPYICAGQPFTYNHGAYDAEGDSLVYDLIAPRTDGLTTLTPAGGTSPTQPFATTPANGLSFNPSNGTMTFTPSGLQNSVVVVRVREYRNGVLISTVMRDMQVVVISCSNNAPTLTSPVATTGGTFTNSATGGTFRVCAGNTLTFQVTGNDANLTDILSMTSNFPGATIVQVGNNPAVFTVTVPTSTATIGQYNFTLRIQDNACPIFGSFTIAYDLYIQGIDNISVPSNPVCTSTAQSFPMTAFVPGGLPAGATITWSPSTFLSSTSGSTVTVNLPANAALPITYTATYSNGVCTNQQTLTLNGGTLTLSVTPATATVCTGSTVTLNANATASGGAVITYAWAPSATLSASNISNPVATPTASTVYVVTATANGCTATASSNVTLGTATTAASNTGPYCGGATIQLNATGGTSYSWSGPGGFTSTSASPTLTGATSAMAGTYTATITTASGCTATQATNVTVNQYSVSVTPAAPFVCGTAAALTATLYNNGTAVASSGYNVNPITFTNTTTAGTALTLGDDAISAAIPIGFTFNFFGNNYTQVYIGSNGFITFNGASGSGCCSGGVIPTAGNGVDDFIALAWNDLYPPGAGTITYSVQGTAPNRIFVVSYTGIPHCCGSTAAITGQILLYESTNNIEIYSGSIVNDGSTMTQGIENVDGTQGFFVPGRNSADWSATSSAYQFAPVQPATYAWGPATGLSATNISNPTANPASTTTYTVTATAGGCTATATVTVTVGALPPPTASGTTICPNSTATLTATASNTIEWYNAATGGTLLSTGASYTTPALTTTTTYYVQQVSGACVSTRTAVVVTVGDVTPPTIVNCPANITLTASGAGCTAPASWTAPTATDNCPAGCITNPLSTILTNFTANSATIAATVPSRFTFAMDATNGVNDTNISDGGSDMYDGGNFINTNLATSISYSNNTIINSNSFGTGGQYFTSYQNGIFMLAANVNNLSTFGISGNNGADGGGTTDGATFSITINCQTYNVFLRRVYNATDPSINQMIIIPANASASQTFPNDTNDGTQTLSGISATTRIYYLLYAGTSGSFINNATAQTIATTFITQLGATTSTSITIAQTQGPASGSNFPVGTTNIQYTATDVAGNSSTCNFTVTVNSTVTASVTPASAALTCATPSTTLTASGGGTYLWNATGGNATTAAITASAAGTYVVTVTGTNGCTATAQSVVTSGTTVPVANVTPASATLTCTTTSTTLTASGGATYLWNAAGGNATTAAITASAAGTYVVTITAANGCTATAQSVISSNTTPPTASVTPASATLTCTTTSTGLTASGGGTYLWNATGGNATTAAITASAAGTYVVTVTSATNGCTATAQSVISSNTTPPTASVTPASATLTCTTTSTGLTASGGGTYLWNATGGNATTAAITASAAGTYVVTVTSATNGCTATAQSVISSNTTPPTASVTPASATLTCTTTSIGLTASGGGTYLWNATGGNATTAAITASAAGTYVVTVTSATNGCTATAQSVITSNTTPPTASVTPASATLTCTTTSTSLTASGGGTYLWNATGGNATTAAITASAAGTYVVTVTSATNGCTATAQSVITSNTTPPTASVTPASATLTCTTTNTGLTASGGGTYLWNATGGNATTAAITASAAGTYVVTVTSATNGCTVTAQSVITSNTTPPTASISPASPCVSPSATLTASGGGTYLWNAAGANATTAAITASTAGTYAVTVTSATNGCTATASVVASSTVVVSNITTTCAISGATYTVSFNISGGDGTYLVNGSAIAGSSYTSANINSGTAYNFSVSDGNACPAVAVTGTNTCTAPTTCAAPAGCYGPSQIVDGSFEAFNAATPFANFTSSYDYSTCPGSICFNGATPILCQYDFSVQTNPNGCNNTWSSSIHDHTTGTGNMMIVDFPVGNVAPNNVIWSQTVTLLPNTAYCFGAYFINLLPTGSNQPLPVFTFTANGVQLAVSPSLPENEQWNFYGAQFNSGAGGAITLAIRNQNFGNVGYDLAIDDITVRELIAGTPPTMVADAATFCNSVASTTINVLSNDSNVNTAIPVTIATAPPFTDGVATVNANNTITFTPAAGFTGTTSFDYRATSLSGCTAQTTVTVTVNASPTVSVSPASATLTCTTTSTSLTASGGASYLWNATGGNATTAVITASTAGTYVVTATAGNTCTATAQAVISSNTTPPTASVTPASATLTCTTTSTGLTASGGGTYLWNAAGGNATTAAITASAAGTYVVTVTNTTNGCTATAQSVITSNTTPPTASVTPASATLTCTTTNTGLTASGGGTYLWNATGGNATTAAITASAAGTYVVTVTSATNGCTATAQSVITSNTTPPTASVTPVSAILTCITTSTGLTASGGGTYLWNATGGNATTAAITASAAGTYVVTVTNTTNGCTATAQSVITSNTTAPTASVTPANATLTCTTTSTSLTASGGGTYAWNPTGGNAATAAITASAAGTYVVTVTDATNGCTATAQSVVTSNVTPPSVAITPSISTLTCASTSSTLTASGALSYVWSTGATTASINVTVPNTYSVTGTAANGCTATASTIINQNITAPTASVTPNSATVDCSNPTVTLTASGGVSYLWGTGATTASINANAAGSYPVTVTAANGCTAIATANVNANQTAPTANISPAGPTITIANGSTTVLTATGGTGYVWSTGATTNSITVSTSGTYTVTVTDAANGCTAVATRLVVVLPPEVCTNGVDDDGDGFVDCADPDCSNCNTVCGPSQNYLPSYFSSGSNGYNQPLAIGASDLHWTSSLVFGGTQTPAVVVGQCVGAWINSPFPGSQWIGHAAYGCGNTYPGQGTVYFSYNFNLPANQVPSYAISLDLYADNLITGIWVNGTLVNPGGFGGFTAGTQTTVNLSGFVAGSNTITIALLETAPAGQSTPGGLLVQASVSGDADGDGVSDANDNCPNTPSGTAVDAQGCPAATASSTNAYCPGNSGTVTALPANATAYSWSGPNGFTANTQTATVNNINGNTTFTVTATLSNGCTSSASTVVGNTGPLPEVCTNGIDDDCDGLIDALDPDCCGGWETRGTATAINNVFPYYYHLTDATTGQGGGVWSNSRFDFSQSFSVTYQAYFGTIDGNGADGMAFVIHNDPLGYNAPIVQGGGLGVGMTPCFTTEFDTYDNGAGAGDIAADHTAIYANSQANTIPGGTAVQASATNGNIEDGLWHDVSITWNATTQTFTVNFDGVQRLQTVYNFVQNVFSNNPILYFGFTASTGGSVNVQEVRNIVVNGTRIEVCGDGIDNDCDNLVDCADTDCQFTASASAPNSPCGNASIPLSVTTSPVIANHNVLTPTYSWTGVGGFTSTAASPTVTSVNSNADGAYNVTVTANGGCTAAATTNVVTLPAPVPVVTNDGPHCPGTNLVLTATNGVSYAWSGPNGFTATGATATVTGTTPASSGVYSVTVTAANGCTGTGSTSAIINTTPSVSAGADQTLCGNATAIIATVPSGGLAPYTYTWDNGLGAGQQQTVGPNQTTTYTVTATDANGCTGSDNMILNVVPITLSPNTQICLGTCTTLTATGGAGLLGVTWTPTTGLSASQGLTVTACPTATTTYTATYATPGASFITNGTFTGSTGGFSSSYIYSPTNLVPEGTYAVITNPQSAHTGFSACPDHTGGGSAMMVVNGSGTANTVVWSQTVPVTPNTDYQFSTWVQSVAAGSPAQLQFSINGVTIGSVFNSPAATCTWQQFFQIWNSGASTTATISIINQNTSTGGNDFALDDIAFSPVCLRTRQVTVTVNSVTPTISSNTPICAGTDLNLTASGGTDYNWSGANTFTSTVQNPTITAATTAATGNYNVTITDAATGCTATATTSVVVNPLPVVTVTGGGSYCEGSAIQLTATGGGTYAWSGPNGFTSNIANPNIPVSSLANDGVYTVTVTTAAGCTATASLTLVINTLPTPTAANNTPICAGLDLNLTGTGGGTYAWAGPNGFASALQNPTITAATAAASGTYSLTVTNAAGCTALATTLATVNANPTTTASSNSPICEGFTLNLSATGLLSYAWSGPNGFTANTVSPSLANATPAASGVYIVTITDGNSCTATSSVNVTVNTTPTVTATNNTPVCTGASIQLTATGGTTYAWSGPSGYTANVSNPIIASSQMTNNGTYSVTVTDANGCSAVTTTNVVVHETPTLAMNTVTPPTCFGLSNGSINIDEALGQAPFTYTWSNPTFGNVEDPTNIVGAGTYSVTVTTADGCTATMSNIVVTEPAVLALTLNSTSNVLCNAECNGTITITASGGTAAYNYTWSDPAFPNTANPTTVCAGTYSVTVTDQQACTATLSNIVITEPAVLTATADTTNVSCFNACNGAIDVTATGGTLPYTYAWSGTLGNVEDPTNVCAGVYSVTITDANACTFVINNITIQEPSDLTVTVQNIVDAQCFNACDGTINMDVVGGSAPYTFQWNNPAFGNTQSPTSIVCAGTYSVTVTDSHGCFVVINNIVVGQPALLTSTLIGTTALTCNPVNANGTTNGAIDIDVQGGTATYNYQWSNLAFGNVQDPTGVAAGTYSVTVTDLQSCTVVLANIVVTEPAPISATFVVVNDQCNPANNPVRTGSADMTVTGGTGPYTYVWSNGALTEDIQNLGTGAYDVTITDQNGCTSTASVFITEPTPIILTTTHTDATCFGASNGGIDLSASGGTQGATGYTYLWTNGAVTQDLSNIPAGNYCVTTTDANGCTASACVTISQPTQLVVTIGNVLQATCNGTCNGRATAQATGGTSAINVYTYEWDGGQATPTATGLCAGTHTVTVTDDNGCTATASVIITEPTSLDLNIATTNVSCFANANDGTATATATGGVAPYSFEWSNNLVGQSVTGLQTGNYDVTVTDANSCTYSEPFFIASPNPFIITPSTTNATCFGLSDGTISVNPFGGTAPYTYLWSDAQLTAMAVGIPANITYSVTVTDAQGCTSTAANLSVSEPTQLTSVTTVETTVTCNGEVDGSASVSVAGGTPAYTYLWDNFETSNMAIALAAGTHRVTITDNNGCTTVNTVAMSEPAVLQAEVSHTNVVCYNEANGAILIDTVFGGTAPYEVSLDSITWATNISAGYVFDGLTAGVYDIWLRDANGCMLYFTQSISQPTDIGVSVDGITIQLGENGELNPVVLNLPIGAIYTWSPADSTISCLHCMNPTVDPVETTVYTLTVQGANGCSDSDTAIVVVDKERRVYIPTAFTPNSDDNNDTFTIYGGSGVLRVKRMLIFDRWGELIYEQSNFPPADPSYGWDGTFKGKPVNPTAFVYYIEVEFADGQVLPYKGDVSVIK